VSPTYRNDCRPPTGTASATCQPGTGTPVSSMNRRSTRPRATPMAPTMAPRSAGRSSRFTGSRAWPARTEVEL